MKKIIALLIGTMLLTGCGSMGTEEPKKEEEKKPDVPKDEITKSYEKDGISFDIPELWQKNFKAVTREAGSSGNTYPQTDFYYTEGERDIRMMSLAKFTREQWDSMKSKEESADDVFLSESPDKKYVYTLHFEDHDYITDEPLRDTLGKVRKEAEKLRDGIVIK